MNRVFLFPYFLLTAVLGFTTAGYSHGANPDAFVRLGLEGRGANCRRAAGPAGNWLGAESGDMSVLPAGPIELCNIPFLIGEADSDNCILTGGDTDGAVLLKTDGDVQSANMYVAHTAVNMDNQSEASILLKYSDGTEQRIDLRPWVDFCDWKGTYSGNNSVHAWMKYNGAVQTSVYVSKFSIGRNDGAALCGVEFSASGMSWVVFGVTFGPDSVLTPLQREKPLTAMCTAAPSPEKPLRDFPEGMSPKNVILVIGDGMGVGAHELTSGWCKGRMGDLFMHRLPHGGLCTTHSRSSEITDSAAAGTAIATGSKVRNGFVSVYSASGAKLYTIAEGAEKLGKSVAIMTTDKLDGATPAVFYSHSVSRHDKDSILGQIPSSGFDVFLGNKSTADWFSDDSHADTRKALEKGGFAFPEDAESFISAVMSGSNVLGHVSEPAAEDERELSCMSAAVFERFSANTNGFFVMIESHLPDPGGHYNDPDMIVIGTAAADWVTKAAVDFASKRNDTLVLTTADHETGAVVSVTPWSGKNHKRTATTFHSVQHTGSAVPLFAFGPGAEKFDGVTDNTDIAKNIAGFWGVKLTPVSEK